MLLQPIELGIETSKQKEQAFFELAERFRASDDPDEAKQLRDKLARMVFGEQIENFEPSSVTLKVKTPVRLKPAIKLRGSYRHG